MKTHPSSNRLVFHLYSVPIVGLVFLLFGGVFYVVTVGGLHFHCAHGEDHCVLERTGLVGARTETVALGDIHRANVDRRYSRSSDGHGGYKYIAVLETKEGTFDLSPYSSSSSREHSEIVAEVNRFLEGSRREDLSITQESHIAFRIGALLCGLIGLFMIFGVRSVAQLAADPSSRQLTIERRRWWQRSGVEQSVSIDEIEHVDIETKVTHRGHHRRSTGTRSSVTHKCVLVLSTGERVPVFKMGTSGSGAFKRRDAIEELLRGMSAKKLGAASSSHEPG